MPLSKSTSSIAFLLLLTIVGTGKAEEAKAIDFEKQIAPILVSRCLSCHDATEKLGGLDLTHREAALAGGESGSAAITPSQPDSSYLLARIQSKEMPPEKAAPLTDAEIELFAEWIKSGAAWPKDRKLNPFEFTTDSRAGRDWWSLQPIVRPQVPVIASDEVNDWPANPIDHFVLAKLQANDLSPAPVADKRTLIRRVTFDLLGLPPTPAEVEAFLADDSPDAYEKLVDRLLASPRYGERWARHWLDVAHYADTHGFERDFRRDNAWPYRDYVIDAFNSDKPYDVFLREQIAGDVIDRDNPKSVIAMGFLAAGPWDFVGHKENKDPKFRRVARADDLDDMVTTVMTATQGLTVNCARCHNHKFDPISQRDYYQLWAVFAGVQREDRALPPDPELELLQDQLDKVNAERNRLQRKGIDLADIVGGGDGNLSGPGSRGRGIDPRNGKGVKEDSGFLNNVKPGEFVAAENPLVDGVFVPGDEAVLTISTTGLSFTGLNKTSGRVWDHVKFGPSHSAVRTEVAGVNYNAPPNTLLALHANKGVTFDLTAIRRSSFKDGPAKLRFQSTLFYGGAAGVHEANVWILLDGKEVWKHAGLANATGGLNIDVALPAESQFLTLIATEGKNNDISHDQVCFGNPKLIPELSEAEQDSDQQRRLAELDQAAESLQKQITHWEQHHPQIKSVYAAVSATLEPIHILKRGDTESPGEEVQADALSCLPGVPFQEFDPTTETPEAQRRLALANWITHPANPLTPRVMANRLWHYHFGTGIVNTPSDFGFLGGEPSHPQLLDWLAAELVSADDSLKHLQRLIVTSQTYRQAGNQNDQAAAIDADNRWLWRREPRRLEAEVVRDSILSASGNLNLEMGGPGYRDFKFIERYAPIYQYVTADKPELWRRSVYRFTVRSVPNQFLEVLDCPNPSNLAPRRTETTTALQALALMNDDFVTQQAAAFAERIQKSSDDTAAQIQQAYELAFARKPSPAEQETAAAFIEAQGLFAFCRVLLNTNEFLYVD